MRRQTFRPKSLLSLSVLFHQSNNVGIAYRAVIHYWPVGLSSFLLTRVDRQSLETSVVLYHRQYRYEQKLARLLWKVEYKEIKDIDQLLLPPSSSAGLARTGSLRMKKHHIARGNSVRTKSNQFQVSADFYQAEKEIGSIFVIDPLTFSVPFSLTRRHKSRIDYKSHCK